MNWEFLIDFITALWLGFLGGCIGSFLNVVAYRLPRGISVVWKPSHCPKCNHPIRFRDNVPVFGWLWLRGRCRDCGASISARYAIIEAVMGLVFFILAFTELLHGSPHTDLTGAIDVVWNPQWRAIGSYAYHCLLVSILVVLFLMRLDRNISLKHLIAGAAFTLFAWTLPLYFL